MKMIQIIPITLSGNCIVPSTIYQQAESKLFVEIIHIFKGIVCIWRISVSSLHLYFAIGKNLQGQCHEKVDEIRSWDVSLGSK
jgi:hypothetical protein